MMSVMEQISSPWLVAACVGWFVAQVAKTIVCSIKKGKFDWREFLKSGGMPSSHSSTVVALTTAIGMDDGNGSLGIGTPLFALALVMAIIVIYDATNVRRATGEQGDAINELIGDTKKIKKPYFSRGHKPAEAVIGSIIGVLTGVIVVIAFRC